MSHRVRHVPFAQRRLAPLLARFRGLGPRLARWESAAVMDRIGDLESQTPVWICGMARSGSTILLHMLDALPSFTTHRYSDYPWMWTPYWWNHLYARLPLAPARKQERAHRDAIEVTPQSPEAFEEMFWMHFFYGRHDPAISQVLDGETHNEEFQRFFDQHQRKVLAIRGARRYLAKANYQLARLGYLHRLYPKARFVIPVRNPRAQVDSLIRQDDLFCRLNSEDSAVSDISSSVRRSACSTWAMIERPRPLPRRSHAVIASRPMRANGPRSTATRCNAWPMTLRLPTPACGLTMNACAAAHAPNLRAWPRICTWMPVTPSDCRSRVRIKFTRHRPAHSNLAR